MNLKIRHKLLLLVTIPTIALIIFSLSHFNDKYNELKLHETLTIYSKIIKISSNLIHELQLERGLSSSYLNEKHNKAFDQILHSQIKKTDATIAVFEKYFQHIDKKVLSSTNQGYLFLINRHLKELKNKRALILKKTISTRESFKFFTTLNKELLELAISFETHSNDNMTYNDTITLKKLMMLEEYAGQERALVAYMINSNKITAKDLQKYNSLITLQTQYFNSINHLLQNTPNKELLKDIEVKYKQSYFHIARIVIDNYGSKRDLTFDIFKIIGFGGMIHDLMRYKKTSNIKYYNSFLEKKQIFDTYAKEYLKLSIYNEQNSEKILALQKTFDTISPKTKIIDEMKIFKLYKSLENDFINLDPKKWFEVSSQRINDIHSIEKVVLSKINNSTHRDVQSLKNSLILQISLTFLTILLLQIGAYLISKNINKSIENLASGIKGFFNFLNFKTDTIEYIEISTKDEIYDIAQNINKEIDILEQHLQEDKDFIYEATKIVTMMKNGDFSDRVYFEPNNPTLKELKHVLNELIELITQKVKEQTQELEKLNASLVNEVFEQTMELQEKVKELTIARDKAIQAEIAKDEFLANMSHEIRTPLNAILGFVTILKKRIEDEKSLDYLNIIDNSGKSLLTIINDILDFSKIQSGKFTITPYEIEPLEEFSNAVLLFASKAYEKHLIYAVYIDPCLPQVIKIDAVRVKQILSNLLSNAIKFTPEDGTIKVKIVIEGSNLVISVQDSGIGISKEHQHKIFTAFEQADGSTTRKYGGTGLGLSISAKLSSLMNGELTLHSEENVGSTFTLKLPIEIINKEKSSLCSLENYAHLKFAVVSNKFLSSSLNYSKLIVRYLKDFGITQIDEIDEFEEDYKYDIIFFVPDEDYNEAIINSHIPAVALLTSANIQLANLEYIQPLYAPFIPKSILNAINSLDIANIVQEKTTIQIQHQNTSEEETHYKGKILIAEDNKTNQMLISLILDDYGLEYEIANNGLEAVDMFKKSKYDLILMDENMPELNGIGAMKQIHAFEKQNSMLHTPIIALTASVLDTDKEMFINAGMDGFVGKPINNKELEAELDKYLEKVQKV